LPWDASLRRYWFSRDAQVGLAGLDALAAHHDVRLVHPLSSAEFIASMIATYGPAGPGGRETGTASLAGDLLPEALVLRSGKAAFGAAFWNGPHTEFADRWSGGGVDTSLVDVEVLRKEWRQPELRSFASLMLLQQAWLHDDGVAGAGG
jgi:asparagine synthase (glutamine-hydrolysing)